MLWRRESRQAAFSVLRHVQHVINVTGVRTEWRHILNRDGREHELIRLRGDRGRKSELRRIEAAISVREALQGNALAATRPIPPRVPIPCPLRWCAYKL